MGKGFEQLNSIIEELENIKFSIKCENDRILTHKLKTKQLIRKEKMKNKLMKDVEMIGDALWLNYKGYDIRIEKTKQFNNNNLVITVTPKGKEDYTDRLEVEE